MKYNKALKEMIDRQLKEGKKEEILQEKEIKELFKQNARAKITVYGKVQGVFFRAFVKREADKLGVTGSVRNVKDHVEAVAEGDKVKVRKLILRCKEGPPIAKVEKLEYEWEEYKGNFDKFYINY